MARAYKATYSIYLTPANVDRLKPFFSASGISMSAFFDICLQNTITALDSISGRDFSKPITDLTITEVYELAKALDSSFRLELESQKINNEE